MCLKASKDNFVSCRPIIGLDGCFLKGKYGGELLSVVARDGNDQMIPLAYCVVEVENKEMWSWFLVLLVDDLGGQWRNLLNIYGGAKIHLKFIYLIMDP